MRTIRKFATRFTTAALLSVFFLTAPAFHAAGADIRFTNDMDTGVTGLYCLDEAGKARELAGPVGKESSIGIAAVKFEADCTRIAVVMEDGSGWQFYHEPGAAPAKEIVLSWEGPSRYSEAKYPSLLIDLGDDPYVVPAGVPLNVLTQLMQFGMDEAKWEQVAMPGYKSREQPGAFVVSFADTAWSLSGQGIEYAELVEGMQLAQSVSLAAPFSNPTLLSIFTGMQTAECSPLLFSLKGMSKAFSEEGKTLDKNAVLIPGMDDDTARWENFDMLMEKLADSGGGKARIVFGNEEFLFELVLDLDASEAFLKVVRKEETAFG